ncbi:MAG: DUF6379 domain-containing protein [Sphingopyxis sp.]
MFDRYIIDETTLANTGPADAPTGFQFQARLGYYRGLGLSMIEDLAVTLDGVALPRAAISFDEGPGPISLDAMEQAFDRRWAFGAPATIAVAHPGGLTAGQHMLGLQQKLRISYMPFPSFNRDEKCVTIT